MEYYCMYSLLSVLKMIRFARWNPTNWKQACIYRFSWVCFYNDRCHAHHITENGKQQYVTFHQSSETTFMEASCSMRALVLSKLGVSFWKVKILLACTSTCTYLAHWICSPSGTHPSTRKFISACASMNYTDIKALNTFVLTVNLFDTNVAHSCVHWLVCSLYIGYYDHRIKLKFCLTAWNCKTKLEFFIRWPTTAAMLCSSYSSCDWANSLKGSTLVECKLS